jgi:hypothetical protein
MSAAFSSLTIADQRTVINLRSTVLEWTPRMEAAEGHEAGYQQESKNDFRDSSFDPLPRQELGPIEVHFFGGLGERPLQIVRGG